MVGQLAAVVDWPVAGYVYGEDQDKIYGLGMDRLQLESEGREGSHICPVI